MEQPSIMMNNNNNSATSSPEPNSVPQQNQINMKKMKLGNKTGPSSNRRMPTAEELITHFESQGMDTKQASIKVIDDLQKALFRVVTTKTPQNKNTTKQQEIMMNSAMLRMLDLKIDTKPGFTQMFGIGVASAAVFRGLETFVVPQVVASFANIWNVVRSATSSNPSSSV